MVKKGTTKTGPSHKDLVKTVSKQLKYYFEIKRQEDGFDLSGPECPRPDYPALKSRPMLLYEGLHDRSVKHFYSDVPVKQKITNMTTYNTSTGEAKRMEKLMRRTMDRTSYLPPWMGNGTSGHGYAKNSEKYLAGTFGDWKERPQTTKRRGYGKADVTLKSEFTEPHGAKPRMRRSCPSGWIDNKECNRLVNGASRILASSEFREGVNSRPSSSKSAGRSTRQSHSGSLTRARSASPMHTASVSSKKSASAPQKKRLTQRPQSGRNTITTSATTSQPQTRSRRSTKQSSAYSYHDAKDAVVHDHEKKKTSENLKKNRIYYDIDGRRKPVQHRVRNESGYLERNGETAGGIPDGESSDEKVPDWLRNQMRKQDVNEKKMPFNDSVKSVEINDPYTHKGEDIRKREGVRKRPRSARRSKSRSSRGERDSRVTLSEGSYEEVKLTDSEYESGDEETFVEDRGCQTGWELFVQYDQTENVLYDGEGEATTYKISVRTGNTVGASTKTNIHLILYGARGRSPDLMLKDCENHKIAFQQGAEDMFSVTCSYVGQLNKIQIGHDSEGEAWFLDSVSVQDPTKGEVYELLCNKWMSVKAEDKMTRRHLQISAARKIQPDINIDEDETEAEAEDVIDSVAQTNSPRPSVSASTSTQAVSTTHLNNDTDTAAGSQVSKKKSVTLPSETASTTSISGHHQQNNIRQQDPFVTYKNGRAGRHSPTNIDEFESDIALHSDKKSVSSRRSQSPTMTDSECQTARFEEQSVLSGSTVRTKQQEEELAKKQDLERMESFKAGQKAERERQKREEDKVKFEADEKRNDIMRGPTIHQAARSGDLERINALLDHNNELKDSVNDKGYTALHLASQHGYKEIVQLLAAKGAKLDHPDRMGYEPIHEAALYGHVNCLRILNAMGASINSQTDDSKTPLHLAAMGGHLETSKWLVANRSRLDVEDDFGRTAVEMAENNGHDVLAKELREKVNDMRSNKSLFESKDNKDSWEDDQAEKPKVLHQQAESDDEEASVADLRKEAKRKEETQVKQKAYQEMQENLERDNMTYLDRIRYEVDNG